MAISKGQRLTRGKPCLSTPCRPGAQGDRLCAGGETGSPVGQWDNKVVKTCDRAGPMWRRPVWRWLPPFAWMAVIYFLSTDHLSAPEFRKTWTGILAAKGAHLLQYAGLFLLWYRAIHGTLRAWNPAAAILAFAAASAYAVLDEFHQSFTTHRSGNARDILLDSLGAGFAMIALWAMPRWTGHDGWNLRPTNSPLRRRGRRPPPTGARS